MVSNGFITQSGHATLGAATDSLLMVLSFAGAVALIALIVGIFVGTNRKSTQDVVEHGFLRKKPLLVPSIVFVLSLVIVIALVPHPMAAYYGPNEMEIRYYEEDPSMFRIYDSTAYQRAVSIHVLCFLYPNEESTVRVTFSQNNTEVQTTNIEVPSNPQSETVTRTVAIQMEPGIYEVEVRGSDFFSVTLTQPLISGFITEVTAWESYIMFMTVGSFFFILLGACFGREEKKRFSYERIDQEPPKDGIDYIRRA